ncbi:ABC transporter permease [Leucobacter luti]|uniref:Spermidine/putrescine transport system permease protein PotC n=1 Tax=Leucobacter luti TaxID=340320 RepID=A0A4Q7TPN9_9MICO|nr:ABC transporter permease [Leucobacter luti]MBL3699927.1 ABC transporter permease [Leucobacter luti]RZT62755.1 spermidine/putrescine transport system permease protein [Leucobacter luti]
MSNARGVTAAERGARKPGFRALNSFPGFAGIGIALLLFLYLPLAVIIGYSFNANNIVMVWEGFTFDWFVRVFQSEQIRQAFGNSLLIAVWSTALVVILAILSAVGLVSMKRRNSTLVNGLLSAPLILPEIVLAIAILSLFAFVKIPLGIPAMIVGHAVVGLPFALMTIRSRLSEADWSQFEAAADLGANERRIFRRITIPMLTPAIISGGMLSFIVSMDNFIMSFFTAGPGSTTLPLYIWGSLRVGLTPEINALSTMIIVVSVVVLILSQLITRKKG